MKNINLHIQEAQSKENKCKEIHPYSHNSQIVESQRFGKKQKRNNL